MPINSWASRRTIKDGLGVAMMDNDLAMMELILQIDNRFAESYQGNLQLIHWAALFDLPEIIRLLSRYGADINAKAMPAELDLLRTLSIKLEIKNGGRIPTTEEVQAALGKDVPEGMPDEHAQRLRSSLDHINDILKDIIPPERMETKVFTATMDPGQMQPDVTNWTPLMCAAFMGSSDAVDMLLELGADKTLRDVFGWNAAKIAMESGYVDIALRLGGL